MAIRYQQDTELTRQATRNGPPAMWQVVLLNDDFTPMDFVTTVLQTFFNMGFERATQIMLQIHTEGRGVCGVFPKDIAATKVSEVTRYARQNQHPLQCIMEIQK